MTTATATRSITVEGKTYTMTPEIHEGQKADFGFLVTGPRGAEFQFQGYIRDEEDFYLTRIVGKIGAVTIGREGHYTMTRNHAGYWYGGRYESWLTREVNGGYFGEKVTANVQRTAMMVVGAIVDEMRSTMGDAIEKRLAAEAIQSAENALTNATGDLAAVTKRVEEATADLETLREQFAARFGA